MRYLRPMIHVTLPVMLAAIMPNLLTLIAKTGVFTARDNHETRAWQSTLTGWRQRAHWAHLNSYEAFPPFAAGAILAYLAAPHSTTIPLAAWGFVACRVAYAACYITDRARLRSVVWFLGVICVVALFVVALTPTGT